MAENFNDYGEYSSELAYKNKSPLQKLFSFRTLKKLLKLTALLLIVGLYAVIFLRLFTSEPSRKMSAFLWTRDDLSAYASGGLDVYTQDMITNVADDGKFSVYDMRYVAQTHKLQITIRYNDSTLEALKEEYPDDEISETPFIFALYGSDGRMYTDYSYVVFRRTIYHYIRVSFDNVDLFASELKAPDNEYFTPDDPAYSYIYKGVNKAEYAVAPVSDLYLLSFYGNGATDSPEDTFGNRLSVYRRSYDMTKDSKYDSYYTGDVSENMLYYKKGK